MMPVHPAVFAIGIFVVFCIVIFWALCAMAKQADEDMERERQIARAKRDIEEWR